MIGSSSNSLLSGSKLWRRFKIKMYSPSPIATATSTATAIANPTAMATWELLVFAGPIGVCLGLQVKIVQSEKSS